MKPQREKTERSQRKALTQETLADGIQGFDINEQLHKDLRRKGMRLAKRPKVFDEEGNEVDYHGQLPDDISSLSDTQLYEEMERQTKWSSYVDGQLSNAQIQLNLCKRTARLVQAKVRLLYRDKGEEQTGATKAREDAKDLAECDRTYLEHSQKQVYWECMVAFITTIKKASEDAYALLSRRVTQRGQELERERRQGNVPYNLSNGPGRRYGPRNTHPR